MPVIDTSFLLAVFDEDHPRHKEAQRLMHSGEELQVSGGVLGEFTTIIRRRANDVGMDGEELARDLLRRVEGLRIIRHAEAETPKETSRVYRAHKGISYVDAWGIALALSSKQKLFSFDRRQKSVHRDEGQRK